MRNTEYTELTDEQLVKIYQNENNNAALEFLIKKYNKFIHKIASGYYWRTNLENEDILSYAYTGFMKGVERYDHTQEGYFMYFTGTWMKTNIFVAIDNESRTIRIPINRLKDMRKIDSLIATGINDYFSFDDIAKLTGIPEKKVEKYMVNNNNICDISLFHSLEDTENFTDKNLIKKDLIFDLKNLLNTLSKTEQYVLIHSFGLFGSIKMDNTDIGEYLGVSNERIRQIKDKCIRKLRHSSFSSILIQYLD